MRTVNRCSTLLLLSLLLPAGCALRQPAESPDARCEQALTQLQNAVADAGVGDAQYHPVAGFPTYRSNRFWSSFAGQPLTPEQAHAWREQLHRLGMESLAIEWRNLPLAARANWQQHSGFADFTSFAADCSGPALQASALQPLTADAVKIPDAYNTWQRVLGLYALTRYGARSAIADYQREMRTLMHDGPAALQGETRLFAPPGHSPDNRPDNHPGDHPAAHPGHPPERYPAPAGLSLLGIPVYAPEDLQRLLHWHAPHWQIEQQSTADLPGAATWHNGVRQIDTARPTLYTSVSHIRHGQHILLQLNYLLWFSERPPQQNGDWYSGVLDGLIWRVTLKPDGDVLFYDSIHPCGCYHTLHLPRDSTLTIPQQGDEPLLALRTDLPARTRHPQLLVQAGTHYLLQVQPPPPATAAATTYALEPYDQLRALPTAQGFRNWFDADGLIAASARRERFYLWPLGVPNAGAMRQQGQHAIAFLGRRHFDEASIERLLGLAAPE